MKKFLALFFLLCLLSPISAPAALYEGNWNFTTDSYPELGTWSATYSGLNAHATQTGNTAQWEIAGDRTSDMPDPNQPSWTSGGITYYPTISTWSGDFELEFLDGITYTGSGTGEMHFTAMVNSSFQYIGLLGHAVYEGSGIVDDNGSLWDVLFTTHLTVDPTSIILQTSPWLPAEQGGDVTYSELSISPVVPIPAAVWLFASGLIGLVGIRRRFQK